MLSLFLLCSFYYDAFIPNIWQGRRGEMEEMESPHGSRLSIFGLGGLLLRTLSPILAEAVHEFFIFFTIFFAAFLLPPPNYYMK